MWLGVIGDCNQNVVQVSEYDASNYSALLSVAQGLVGARSAPTDELCFEYNYSTGLGNTTTVTIRNEVQFNCWYKHFYAKDSQEGPTLWVMWKRPIESIPLLGDDDEPQTATSHIIKVQERSSSAAMEETSLASRPAKSTLSYNSPTATTEKKTSTSTSYVQNHVDSEEHTKREIKILLSGSGRTIAVSVATAVGNNHKANSSITTHVVSDLQQSVYNQATSTFINAADVQLSFCCHSESDLFLDVDDDTDVALLLLSMERFGSDSVTIVADAAKRPRGGVGGIATLQASRPSTPHTESSKGSKCVGLSSASGSAEDSGFASAENQQFSSFCVFLLAFNPPKLTIVGDIDESEIAAVEAAIVTYCIPEFKLKMLKTVPKFEKIAVRGYDNCCVISFPQLFFDDVQQDDLFVRVADVMELSGKYKLFVGDAQVEVDRTLHEAAKLAQKIAQNPQKVPETTRKMFTHFIRLYFRRFKVKS